MVSTKSLGFLISACAIVFVFSGCSSGLRKHTVTGVVEIDGDPVPEGQLTFEPDDKKLPPEGAKITNGKYSVAIADGSYKVKIIATKKVPLAKGEAAGTPGETEKLVSIIPDHYNAQNPIKAEVKGASTVDFKLSKKK